jgi:hypothetical protein
MHAVGEGLKSAVPFQSTHDVDVESMTEYVADLFKACDDVFRQSTSPADVPNEIRDDAFDSGVKGSTTTFRFIFLHFRLTVHHECE